MSEASMRERLERSLREMLAVHHDNVAQGRVRYAKGSYVHRAEKQARAVLAECDLEDSHGAQAMTTPAERDAISAEAFREAAEIARAKAHLDRGIASDLRKNNPDEAAAFERDAIGAQLLADMIYGRAKEKQP